MIFIEFIDFDRNLIIDLTVFVTFSGFVVHFVGVLVQNWSVLLRDFLLNLLYSHRSRARACYLVEIREERELNFFVFKKFTNTTN